MGKQAASSSCFLGITILQQDYNYNHMKPHISWGKHLVSTRQLPGQTQWLSVSCGIDCLWVYDSLWVIFWLGLNPISYQYPINILSISYQYPINILIYLPRKHKKNRQLGLGHPNCWRVWPSPAHHPAGPVHGCAACPELKSHWEVCRLSWPNMLEHVTTDVLTEAQLWWDVWSDSRTAAYDAYDLLKSIKRIWGVTSSGTWQVQFFRRLWIIPDIPGWNLWIHK